MATYQYIVTMKKTILFAVVVLQVFFAAAQNNENYKILLQNFKEVFNAPQPEKWPKDANGNMDCALIRVIVEGLVQKEAEEVYFGFAQNTPAYPHKLEMNGERCVLNIFITPSDESTYIDAALDSYGKSNRVNIPELKERHCYEITLMNNKRLPISFKTEPSNAVVRLENGEKITTPGTMNNVVAGRHFVTVTLDGKTLLKDTINVSESNVHFDYDLRPKKSVTFTSNPSDIDLFVDDKLVGRTPLTISLPYKSYKVEARKSQEEIDVRTINVSDYSDPNVKLSPLEKKTFNVYAMYKGSPVAASLYVEGELYSKTPLINYRLTYPLKNKYSMEMVYNGNRKEKTVKITKEMESDIEFDINDSKPILWPWQREYDARPIGLSIGYVNKQWVAENDEFKGVLPWQTIGYDADGTTLHGLQLGLHAQPCFSWGGGIYSGLFFEYYYSASDLSRQIGYEKETDMFDRYHELNLYVPLHLYYRIPFSYNVALSLRAGLGMDCGLYNNLTSSENDNKEPDEDFYDRDRMPNRFNFSAEFGVGLRIVNVQLNAQYSKGLSSDGEYINIDGMGFKTVQNKFSFSISYLIPGYY